MSAPNDEELVRISDIASQHYDDDRIATSLELYKWYLRFRPDDVEAAFSYAQCLRVIGRWEEAEEEFLRIRDSGFKYSVANLNAQLAMIHAECGKLESAEQLWKNACERRGAPGWAWILRAANLVHLGCLSDAEACYRKSIGLEEANDDEAYLNLGWAFRVQGRYDEARSAYNKALEITPNYPEAIAGLKSLEGIEEVLNLATNN